MVNLVSSVLDEVRTGVPGYDPFRDASDEFYFDEDIAQTAVDFFPELLTHVKGELAGKPFILEPWEAAIVANIFGWMQKPQDGGKPFRRYNEAFIYVPRKNGKTALIAGLLTLVLVWDGEPGAEIYSAAADAGQAALIFEQAKGMVENSEELRTRLRVYRRAIVYEDMGSAYKPISAEVSSKHGYNAHFVVVDELHAQPNRELVDVLETSMGARRQPLLVHITTADYDRPSICNEKLDYAKKVRDGVIPDPHFLPVVYEADVSDDWRDPEVWKRANPNLGVSLSEAYIKKKCQRAVEEPAFENTFRRLHLNVMTEQDVRLVSLEKWDASAGEPIDESELEGRSAFGAFDLSTTTDLTAWVLLFRPLGEDDPYVVIPRLFIPEDGAAARERKDRVPYSVWARDGIVTMTPGDQIDYRYVRRQINEDAARFRISHIGFDPYNASHLVQELQDEDGLSLTAVRQGMLSMSPATKEMLGLIAAGKLRHGGNPALRWAASNVAAKTDHQENLMPSKASSRGRIDPFVAAIMCVALSMAHPNSGSRYDDGRGILTISMDEGG